jgi:hypothetical protein
MRAVKGVWLSSALFASLFFRAVPSAASDDAYDEEDAPDPVDHDEDDEEDGEDMSDQGLSAGGMDAPNALGETGDQRSQIEKELDESEERDSGRGLEFFWLTADVGFQALSLNALADGGLVASGESSGASGLALGAGAGVRLLYFSLGARFRYGLTSEFTPWSLLGEAALRVPLGKLEPYALLGAGYTAVDGLKGAGAVGGVDLRIGGGLDYYLSDSFSVGAQASFDLLFLSGTTGSATGVGASPLVLLGLHF